MLVFIFIVSIVLLVVFALRGEGSTYGNSINENMKNKLNITDKNYFL
jgi:Na+/H+ antiporter NhaC